MEARRDFALARSAWSRHLDSTELSRLAGLGSLFKTMLHNLTILPIPSRDREVTVVTGSKNFKAVLPDSIKLYMS